MKGNGDQKKLYWTDREREQVRSGASALEVVFLNPDDPIADPTNTLALFGRDMYQIKVAHAIIVDGRERRGLGIGVEMAAAATFGTPVIAVVPRNSLYRQDELEYLGATVKDYVHPHISALATMVVDDFAAAGAALAVNHKRPVTDVAVPGWLDRAIDEYCSKVLPDDAPMIEALERIGA